MNNLKTQPVLQDFRPLTYRPISSTRWILLKLLRLLPSSIRGQVLRAFSAAMFLIIVFVWETWGHSSRRIQINYLLTIVREIVNIKSAQQGKARDLGGYCEKLPSTASSWLLLNRHVLILIQYPWWTFFLSPALRGYVCFFLSVFLSKMWPAFTNCYSCPKFWIFRPQGKSQIILQSVAIPLVCKLRIVGLQRNLAVSTAWRDSPTKNGFYLLDHISKLHLERNLAKPTIRTRARFRHLCAT